MTFKRLTFVIIYFALSSFSLEHSWAAKSNTSNTSDVLGIEVAIDKAIVDSKSGRLDDLDRNNSISHQSNSISLESVASADNNNNSPESAISGLEAEESLVISRNWSAMAMLVTSGITLILLWTLFRQPPQIVADESEAIAPPYDKLGKELAKAIPDTSNNLESKNQERHLQPTLEDVESKPLEEKTADFDIVPELIRDLQQTVLAENDDPERTSLRRKAVCKLTKVGDCRSIEPLIAILPQANELDKELIIEALKQVSSRSFQTVDCLLFAGLQDRSAEVRLNALRDLRNLYQFVAPAIAKIAQMQSDSDYEIRQTATQALQQFSIHPLPKFNSCATNEVDSLVSGEESEANLHLVAYLLAELDARG